MIPHLFLELMSRVFDLDLREYLTEVGRGFCAFSVPGQSSGLRLLTHFGLRIEDAQALLADVERRRLPKATGGYYTLSLDPNPTLGFHHDMLFISEAWQNATEKHILGTAYHEACHCYHQSNRFQPYPESSAALQEARIIRKFMPYYAYEDGCGHEDQWYALVLAAAGKMQEQYPRLFRDLREVVETALHDDWNKEPMDSIDWASLEAAK